MDSKQALEQQRQDPSEDSKRQLSSTSSYDEAISGESPRVNQPRAATNESYDVPRQCTDVWMLATYVVFCLLMIIIGVFAISYGNPLRLIYGVDSFGNICGMKNDPAVNMSFTGLDMSDRPYILFFDPWDIANSRKVCVRDCPEVSIMNTQELQDLHRNHSVSLCQYDFNVEQLGNTNSMNTVELSKQLCARIPYPPTKPVLRRCIPTSTPGINASDGYGYLNDLNVFSQTLGDVAVTWTTSLALSAVAFVTSIVLMICIHWMTGKFAKWILMLTVLVSIGFTSFLWWTYLDIKKTLDLTPSAELLVESVQNEGAFCAYSIISTIVTFILACVVLFLWGRLSKMTRLFKEAGSLLKQIPAIVLLPISTYILLISFFSIWLLVILCVATSDSPVAKTAYLLDNVTVNNIFHERYGESTVLEYSDSAWVKSLWWVYVIGLIWCSEFILACQKMIIASSIATWYFSRNREELRWLVFKSMMNMGRYHLGSMALGSLVITIVRFPRLILAFFYHLLKRRSQGRVSKALATCCTCCLQLFESILRMCHHNAYTVIAVQGVNFCAAARLALEAVLSNSLHLNSLNSIGDFILFSAKVTVASITGIIATIIFRNDDRLYFYAIPVLITLIFTYYVAHAVISVGEITLDTLFLCFCEDHNMCCEMNVHNFYAPQSLRAFLIDESSRRELARARKQNKTKSRIPNEPKIIGEELQLMKMKSVGADEV